MENETINENLEFLIHNKERILSADLNGIYFTFDNKGRIFRIGDYGANGILRIDDTKKIVGIYIRENKEYVNVGKANIPNEIKVILKETIKMFNQTVYL